MEALQLCNDGWKPLQSLCHQSPWIELFSSVAQYSLEDMQRIPMRRSPITGDAQGAIHIEVRGWISPSRNDFPRSRHSCGTFQRLRPRHGIKIALQTQACQRNPWLPERSGDRNNLVPKGWLELIKRTLILFFTFSVFIPPWTQSPQLVATAQKMCRGYVPRSRQ